MGEQINIAIIDDEKIQVELLKKYVINWAKKENIRVNIESFYSAEGFDFTWSMDKNYHILLLDIQMSGQNGFELAKNIREEDSDVNIIFITAITDYISEGYDVAAINYLIKPIKEDKLISCLNKAKSKLNKNEKIILLNVDGQTLRVRQSDIEYVEAFAHNVEVNTLDSKYNTKKSISAIEVELDKADFIRCHRSYIVGLKHIKRIGTSELELDSGKIIPISRRQYVSTNRAFINYFRGNMDE